MKENMQAMDGRSERLSTQEREIVRLGGQGLTDKEIAAQLEIRPATVRTYWERIRNKLEAANRAQAIALGLPLRHHYGRLGLIRLDVLRRIPDEVIVLCTRLGQFLTWNLGVSTLFGYDEVEWIGKGIPSILTPESAAALGDELDCARSEGSCFRERWHVRKDGSLFWATNLIIAIDPLDQEAGFLKIVRAQPAREAA